MRLPPCCNQVGEASVQPVSVNLWAGRAVVAEAHFDAHHNVFAQRRSRLKVERAVLCGAAACYAWDARLRPWAALELSLIHI